MGAEFCCWKPDGLRSHIERHNACYLDVLGEGSRSHVHAKLLDMMDREHLECFDMFTASHLPQLKQVFPPTAFAQIERRIQKWGQVQILVFP